MVRLARGAWIFGWACSGGETDGSGTETDTDTDSDTDADTDSDTDTDPSSSEGLVVRTGSAVVGADYVGSEDLTLVGDEGYGAVVCQIHYDLLSTALRTDCASCVWAFDLTISNAAVVTDTGGACLAASGFDATTVSALDGTIVPRGYDAEYAGHARVMMVFLGGKWQSASYANFDDATGAFSYEWEDGFVSY